MYAYIVIRKLKSFPDYIRWENNTPAERSGIYCLQDGKKVKWEIKNNRVRVYLPQNLKTKLMHSHSLTRQAIQ